MIDFDVTNDVYVSDEGWMLEDLRKINYISIDSIYYDVINNGEGPMMAMTSVLKSPRLRNKANRNYMKVQELFAKIGGIANAFFMIMYVLTFYYLRFNYFMYIRENTFLINSEDKRNSNITDKKILNNVQSVIVGREGAERREESSQINLRNQTVIQNNSPFTNTHILNSSNLNNNNNIGMNPNFAKTIIDREQPNRNHNNGTNNNRISSQCNNSIQNIVNNLPQQQRLVCLNAPERLEGTQLPQGSNTNALHNKRNEEEGNINESNCDKDFKQDVPRMLYHNDKLCFDSSYNPGFCGYFISNICCCLMKEETRRKYKYELNRVRTLLDFRVFKYFLFKAYRDNYPMQ